MAKWDLSKLPEGRKPLPDEWFAERAQMQERIKELEAKLAIYETALKHIAQHDTQMRAIKALSDAKGDDND